MVFADLCDNDFVAWDMGACDKGSYGGEPPFVLDLHCSESALYLSIQQYASVRSSGIGLSTTIILIYVTNFKIENIITHCQPKSNNML